MDSNISLTGEGVQSTWSIVVDIVDPSVQFYTSGPAGTC